MTNECTVKNCINQYSRTFHVSYTFPGWFLARTVDMVAAMTYVGEPSFGMKVRNRTSHGMDGKMFNYARNGNTNGIIELFKQRKASPNDLSSGGATILHFPLELGHIDTCKFLLDIGVDPYFEDDGGNSVAHEVSSLILSSKTGTPLTKAYESTFTGISSSHSELWDFSYIHKVVVGIQMTDLSTTLQDPRHRSTINVVDSYGRTALHWAALRGDEFSIRLLLEANADVTATDREGRTAFHAALQSGDLRSVELLLMAGSSVHTPDIVGHRALQIATWAHNSCLPGSNVPILRLVYLAGASVNASDHGKISALQSAACLDRVANAKYLLSVGADPNNIDKDGDVPLFECLYHNTHGTLSLLLEHENTRLDIVNKKGRTILHIAALFANLGSLEILSASSRLGSMELEVCDVEGKTAKEIFEDRTVPPDEHIKIAFEILLRKVSAQVDTSCISDEDDNDEETIFVDASESLAWS